MKKLFLLTLAALLAFSLAVGCGRNDDKVNTPDPGTQNGQNGQNDMNNAGDDIADGAGEVIDGKVSFAVAAGEEMAIRIVRRDSGSMSYTATLA